jgi:hypothetical protein
MDINGSDFNWIDYLDYNSGNDVGAAERRWVIHCDCWCDTDDEDNDDEDEDDTNDNENDTNDDDDDLDCTYIIQIWKLF